MNDLLHNSRVDLIHLVIRQGPFRSAVRKPQSQTLHPLRDIFAFIYIKNLNFFK